MNLRAPAFRAAASPRRVFIVGGEIDTEDPLDPFSTLRRKPPPGCETVDVGAYGQISLRAFRRAFRPGLDVALFDATRAAIDFDLEAAFASAPGGVVATAETTDVARVSALGAPILALGMDRRAPLARLAAVRAARPEAEFGDGEGVTVRATAFGDASALYAVYGAPVDGAGRIRLAATSAPDAAVTSARLRRFGKDDAFEVVAATRRAEFARAARGAKVVIDLRFEPANGETDASWAARAAGAASARIAGPLETAPAEIEAALASPPPAAPTTASSPERFAAACLKIGVAALAANDGMSPR